MAEHSRQTIQKTKEKLREGERIQEDRDAHARSHHILVVDDELDIAETITWVLQSAGYNAAFALNAKTAIQFASRIAIDLALLDINLPDSDGIQAAVEICKRLPNCKILLMSGDPESAIRLKEAAKNDVHFELLIKPIGAPELLKKMGSLLK